MAAMNPTEPLWKRAAFVGCAALSLVPVAVPALKHLASPIALGAGVAFALLIGNPWPAASAKHAKKLLQASVVGLGFGMSLSAVWKAGAEGIGYTVAGIYGEVITVVTRAIKTIMVNTARLMTPRSRPMLSTTSSINPRVFINTPMAMASFHF